ncbi:MAG: type VI secretion system baseplate subunit TssF [Myxococcales bacterium]|nr:type VI secretion system baseplate subunit TssF [Myxococcales bacterium]
MFSKYYQSELTYLRDLGREFGKAFPNMAGMLAERGGDPDVERLMEGFAFLTARIRERLDDDVPEVIHTLSDLLLPHFLRTLPACTIVEFTPVAGALRSRQKIARGTELASTPVEGTSCRFRTTSDVDLVPVTLTDVVHDTAQPSYPTIRLQLQTHEAGRAAVFHADGLRFFVQADPAVGTMIYLWMMHHLRSVQVRGLSQGAKGIELGRAALRPAGFDPTNAMLPWPRLAPAGYRNLQEFFSLPSKFLFFDVKGLDAALSRAEDRFEIVFQFERPPALPSRIGKDIIKLHCTPAINLFAVDADPVKVDPLAHEYLLRASEIDPRHSEIYSVDKVTGLQAGRTERREYRPFFDYLHAISPEDVPSYYRARRATSPLDEGVDVYLSLHTPRDISVPAVEETLSIELTCTNRGLPTQLKVGDVSVPAPGSPPFARFKNITPVTVPVRPPFGQALHWRLIAHLALNYRALAEVESLRSLLEIYNFQALVDRQAARANRLRIEGLRSVATRPVERLVRGVPVRGIGITLELDESSYAGEGDLYLFASVLDEVLAAHAGVNTFCELKVKSHPSQAEYSWKAKAGQQPVL